MSITLTQDIKEAYIGMVHKLWPQTHHYTANDVNEDVVRIVNTVVEETLRASQGVSGVIEALEELLPLYRAKTLWKFVKKTIKLFREVAEGLESHRRYRFIIDTARLKYRSPIEIALMGL